MLPDISFVVTRPSPDHRALLDTLGDTSIHSPAFELLPESEPRLASMIARLDEFDIAIITSPFAAHLLAERSGICAAERVQFIVPGSGSAAALGGGGHVARFPDSGGTSEHILDMPEFEHVQGKRIAIVGAPGGRGLLASELSRRGARVESMHVYRRHPLRPARRLLDALEDGHRLVVFISSLQAFRLITASLPDELRQAWLNGKFVVSSERIESECRNAGVGSIRRAAGAADDSMLAAAVEAGWLRTSVLSGIN